MKELEFLANSFSPNDWVIIEKAYYFAQKAHQGQKRLSGEDYFIHPIETAKILANWHSDPLSISAALLHDVPEDTTFTLKQIEENFGSEVKGLVEAITKLSKIKIRHNWQEEESEEFAFYRLERQTEMLRRMFLAMAKDMRVILIKMADRLHNMRTISYLPLEKQRRIAKETLEIFAPLASRLGMGEAKGELEDIAFPIVYPDEYQHFQEQVELAYERRAEYAEKIRRILAKDLVKAGYRPIVQARAKHWYSLYKKLQKYPNIGLKNIYDLVALRVIVNSQSECYSVLGMIHEKWKPVPRRFKDYIATPKPNGYQSLHTTVFCEEGQIVEIQIRTQEMHQQAEYGVAAHWHYTGQVDLKEKLEGRGIFAPTDELKWVEKLAQTYKRAKNTEELNELKLDFFQNHIFCFTPQGDVQDLPIGSTPVDFAYAIHEDIGHYCSGALVNGKMIRLEEPLESGDIVEILINKKGKGPKTDWLEFVKTERARSEIRKWLRNQKGI